MAGFLSARLAEVPLGQIADPRKARGKRWRVEQLLGAILLGQMAGCKCLKEIEALTDEMSVASKRLTGIARRLPDTTARDFLTKLSPTQLRALLQSIVLAAKKRKALQPTELPIGVIAMDGKGTALPAWDDLYAQRTIHEHTQTAFGHLRTITATLVSARGRPCIDAIPLPPRQNESGFFSDAFKQMLDNFGDLFTLITYDAGACTKGNGKAVVDAGKHYLFRLNDERRRMFQFARTVLQDKAFVAETLDVVDNHTLVRRKLQLCKVVHLQEEGDWAWSHANTFVRVIATTEKDGVVIKSEDRIYVSSMKPAALQPEHWLAVVRQHWGVEINHQTLDTAFDEDDRPFITYSPRGALCALLLRRIAYTLLTLFRSITLRSDDSRAMPWKTLLRWVYNTLIAAMPEHTRNLRIRQELATVFD